MQLLSLYCCCSLLLAPAPLEDAAQKELKKLEGAWLVTAFSLHGQQMSAEQLQQMRMSYQFKGDKCTVKQGELLKEDEATIKLDPTKQPKTIDVTKTVGDGKGQKLQGIYELNDDTLRICYQAGGNNRPTEFSDKAIVITMKRVKQ